MGSRLRQMKKQKEKLRNSKYIELLKKKPMTRRAMNYRCESCGDIWLMWLQTGLEEHGENHKPVPFCIQCKCGGIARHVGKDIHLTNPISIKEGMNYFANVSGKDCGQPVLR